METVWTAPANRMRRSVIQRPGWLSLRWPELSISGISGCQTIPRGRGKWGTPPRAGLVSDG